MAPTAASDARDVRATAPKVPGVGAVSLGERLHERDLIGDQFDTDRHRPVTQNAQAHDRAQVPPNAGSAPRQSVRAFWRESEVGSRAHSGRYA